MKVLVVSNMYPSKKYPAYGVFVRNQVEALRQSGVQIELAIIQDRRKGLLPNLKKYGMLLYQVIKFLCTTRFNVIHVHYFFPTGLLVAPFAALAGTPIVYTAHGGDVRFGIKNKITRIISRFLLTRAKSVIAVSTALAESIVESFQLDRNKLLVASCGVDLDVFFPRDKQSCRKDLGLPEQKQILLYIGNLVPIKGLDNLVSAFSQVKQVLPETVLVFVGEGPQLEALQQQAQQHGLANDCYWFPPVEHANVPQYMSAADLFVLPSSHEGFGLVALEALACGVPVIATAVGGIPEIVADGQTGLLVPPHDTRSLADAITTLLQNDTRRHQLACLGLQSVQHHDCNLQHQKILRCYSV